MLSLFTWEPFSHMERGFRRHSPAPCYRVVTPSWIKMWTVLNSIIIKGMVVTMKTHYFITKVQGYAFMEDNESCHIWCKLLKCQHFSEGNNSKYSRNYFRPALKLILTIHWQVPSTEVDSSVPATLTQCMRCYLYPTKHIWDGLSHRVAHFLSQSVLKNALSNVEELHILQAMASRVAQHCSDIEKRSMAFLWSGGGMGR